MHEKCNVTVSYAQSLDGRIATRSGDSKWISGPETLKLAHRLRRKADAVIVGIGTVLIDDPLLTLRLCRGSSPLRVILDSGLRIPTECRLVQSSRSHPTTIYTTAAAMDDSALEGKVKQLKALGVGIVAVAENPENRVSITGVLDHLAAGNCRKVLIEGGKDVITSFLRRRLVNGMVVVTAPIIIGSGVEAIGNINTPALTEALRPTRFRTRRLGKDLIWEAHFE